MLKLNYANTLTQEIADALGRTMLAVYGEARKLGLAKDPEFIRTHCRNLDPASGAAFRFAPGSVPPNKGKKGHSYPGMEATQFKAGHKPGNWMPIGSHRYSKEGYLQRKVTDTGYPPRDWVAVHILLWEEANGPVPPGHALCFKDGDKTHIELENLELLTRRELMLRNSVHNLPSELKEVIRLKAALQRKINEHD